METAKEIPAHVGASEEELLAREAATRLRNVLRLNAEFSAFTGILALLGGGPLAELFGIEHVWLVRAVGFGLLGFAVGVFLVAGSPTAWLRRLSLGVSIADLGWVAATIPVLVFGWLSAWGTIVMALVAIAVFAFGVEQLRARRRLDAALGETDSDLEESCMRRLR